MSRIIKFRAWDGKQMIYDGDIVKPSHLSHYTDDYFSGAIVTNNGVEIWFYETKLPQATDIYFDHRTKIEIKNLMQFTGLLDCEGREVYESDVYTWKGHEVRDGKQIRPLRTETVIWNYNKLSRLENLIEAGFYEVKVIGNKWENPELLNK